MLVVYDFTNISQFKIIPARSASKYGESVDFSAIFLPNNYGEWEEEEGVVVVRRTNTVLRWSDVKCNNNVRGRTLAWLPTYYYVEPCLVCPLICPATPVSTVSNNTLDGIGNQASCLHGEQTFKILQEKFTSRLSSYLLCYALTVLLCAQ